MNSVITINITGIVRDPIIYYPNKRVTVRKHSEYVPHGYGDEYVYECVYGVLVFHAELIGNHRKENVHAKCIVLHDKLAAKLTSILRNGLKVLISGSWRTPEDHIYVSDIHFAGESDKAQIFREVYRELTTIHSETGRHGAVKRCLLCGANSKT